MNRQIAYSMFSILMIAALVGAGTYAFFSDSGISSNNTFSTGTLDLKLGNGVSAIEDSVTGTFGATDLVPGTCTGPQTLNLKNTGSIAADHAEVKISNVVTDNNLPASPGMDAYLRIQTLTYDGSDVSAQISSTNTTAFLDLADWAADPTVLDNLPLTDTNVDHPLVLDVCLDESAPNEIQGDSVVSTFTVILNQHSSL